jgi:diguanylate cyclase (GGDEF)-like protein
MDIAGFLCREETERQRITDVGRALRPGTPFLIGFFMLAGISGVPAYGWAPLLPPALAIGVYAVMWLRNMPARGRPEQAYAAAFLVGELMLALAIILGKGPQRSYLMILALPVLVAAVVFPKRVVAAAAAFGATVMVVLGLTVARAEVLAVPAVGYAPVFVLASLVAASLVVRDLEDASRRSAFVDELTRAMKRVALPARLAELTHQAADGRLAIAAIVADIDHFKGVNDEHGHVVGDAVLREVVRRLSDAVSAFEPVYRYGGEEFLILLPGHDSREAQEVALRMWHAVRGSPIEGLRVTMSFGVAASAGQGFDFDSLFARADAALYAAKRGGRDWVRTAPYLEADEDAPARRGVPAVNGARSEPGLTGELRARIADLGAVIDGVRAAPVGWTQESRGAVRAAGGVTDDVERKHVLEFSVHLRPMFMFISGGAFVAIAAAIPWFGWQPLIAPVIGGVVYIPLMSSGWRFRRPEWVALAALMLFQVSIAVGFASAHGAPLFALPLMTLMMPGTCAILRGRLAFISMVCTSLMMVAVAFDLAPGQVENAPSVLMFPLALLFEASFVGWIVGKAAVGHSGAGIIDGLTGLLNRTALNARILELGAHAGTIPLQVGMLLIDVDRFKLINDREGHAAGDVVLREVGERVRSSLRAYESAYRLGGEEVLVLLPHTDVSSARDVAERVRRAVGGEPCGGIEVTVSIGALQESGWGAIRSEASRSRSCVRGRVGAGGRVDGDADGRSADAAVRVGLTRARAGRSGCLVRRARAGTPSGGGPEGVKLVDVDGDERWQG